MNSTARKLGIAYGTALKAARILRSAIQCANHKEADYRDTPEPVERRTDSDGDDATHPPEWRSQIFFVTLQGTQVAAWKVDRSCLILDEVAEFRMTRVGKVIVAETRDQAGAFLFYDCTSVPVERGFDLAMGTNNSRSRFEEFGLFLDVGLRRYRGVPREHLILYVEEQTFRFNRRGEDIYPQLARILCGFVPASKSCS